MGCPGQDDQKVIGYLSLAFDLGRNGVSEAAGVGGVALESVKGKGGEKG